MIHPQYCCVPKTAEEAKTQLVFGNRVLACQGILDCFGHISVRNPENPNTYFQSRSLAAALVCPEDILELDLEGNVVSGPPGARPYWESILHARILAVRPDINSVYHGHPAELILFSALPDVPIYPISHSAGVFYNGYGYYESPSGSDMTVKTREEGDDVAQALGDKWAVLMRNHGVTAAAGNVAELVMDMIAMVQNARLNLDCLKMGKTPRYCTEEEGLAYRTSHHQERAMLRNWNYYITCAKKEMPDLSEV